MTPTEIVALMEEIDIAWPSSASDEDDGGRAVMIWYDWLGAFDHALARRALRSFDQRSAPSCAQMVARCRKLAGLDLPPADVVLAEFRRVNALRSSQGPVDPTWFSSPEVGAFASSGAFRAWGESPDASSNEFLAASQAAALASLRRRWDDFRGACEAQGIPAALARLGLAQPAERRGELEPAGDLVQLPERT